MAHLSTVTNKIIESSKSKNGLCKITGINPLQYLYVLKENPDQFTIANKGCQTLVLPSAEEAERVFDVAKDQLKNDYEVLFYPGHDHSPYGGHVASERISFDKFYCLNKVCNESKEKAVLVVTTMEALHHKTPEKNLFLDNSLTLEVSDIVGPDQLKAKLIAMGYQRSVTVEEPGTFSSKGEIFDIYPVGHDPVRLYYFDDMIEEIFLIDHESYKTQRDKPLEKLFIGISPRIFASGDYSKNLRANIPQPPLSFKEKIQFRKDIFQKLSDGNLFEGYPSYIPLFTENNNHFFDFIDTDFLNLHIFNTFKTLEEWSGFYDELKESYQVVEANDNSSCILPSPDKLYFNDLLQNLPIKNVIHVNDVDISLSLKEDVDTLNLQLLGFNQFFELNPAKSSDKAEFLKTSIQKIKKFFATTGKIIFFHTTDASRKEFEHLLDIYEVDKNIRSRIEYSSFPLERGFFYENEKSLFLTEGDLFSIRTKKVKTLSKKELDLFAEQIATLTEGDYVIHNDHGIGKYLGLQSLDLSEDKSDFLVIEFAGKDKVYVPVYKMNVIQKHAGQTAQLSLDSLRTNKFAALKSRASKSIKKLAFDLLKLQAERESAQAFSFSEPDHYYREFELAFEFQETPDQTRAIEQVLDDMQKPRPMDHLVCGDVGFGKTEVAIRAAFKAVLDNKQVAVLVPTTILALQHYNSFLKRLKNFPVRVASLSRFQSAKETSEILANVKEGKIDILIGTHKLLSDKVKFSDLGLVIVDEEQRFGVNHKEKLKLLKANVDFLTLTATPIPRTLQLSFLGLRDLSLIKTPPPKRQTIKTYIIKEDSLTLQTAIRKELKRGGQVYIVHNKVNDIEDFAAKVKDLVPEAQIVIGHGQLNEKELEKRMQAFYEGKYQILIATTIIESGIDIPNANTMIIDRADNFGLSQLHQLRGRIGRSDKKAYAYFIIPSDRNLTEVAEKRLKALQTYADMGSGFNIASCDLEIRGAGDILGANQSGHIEAIGLELYMELLQDAIRELKGEKQVINKNIEITSPFPSYIPNGYIEDSQERLRQYKRLSNAKNTESLQEMLDELNDIYGPTPKEVKNLEVLLKARIILGQCGIKSIQVNARSISIQFDKSALDKDNSLAGRVAQTFLSQPNLYHFSPDYKVLYNSKKELDQDSFLHFCHKIAEQIVPC